MRAGMVEKPARRAVSTASRCCGPEAPAVSKVTVMRGQVSRDRYLLGRALTSAAFTHSLALPLRWTLK